MLSYEFVLKESDRTETKQKMKKRQMNNPTLQQKWQKGREIRKKRCRMKTMGRGLLRILWLIFITHNVCKLSALPCPKTNANNSENELFFKQVAFSLTEKISAQIERNGTFGPHVSANKRNYLNECLHSELTGEKMHARQANSDWRTSKHASTNTTTVEPKVTKRPTNSETNMANEYGSGTESLITSPSAEETPCLTPKIPCRRMQFKTAEKLRQDRANRKTAKAEIMERQLLNQRKHQQQEGGHPSMPSAAELDITQLDSNDETRCDEAIDISQTSDEERGEDEEVDSTHSMPRQSPSAEDQTTQDEQREARRWLSKKQEAHKKDQEQKRKETPSVRSETTIGNISVDEQALINADRARRLLQQENAKIAQLRRDIT